ncbi:MAG: peptidyl-prolyl cis-trans isomerase [Thermoanaerobaculia bacterium]|nr:peptidyl-prolyl cis-trans isomerase [Thermoanaerobaculia bacterium]
MIRARQTLLPYAVLLLTLTASTAAAEPVDRIVLRVNDQIATLGDYREGLAERRQRILSSPQLDEGERAELLDSVAVDVIRSLYEELLMLSRAEQLGIEVPEAAVSDTIAQMREQRGLESEEEMQRALASQGLTMQDLRERMRENLIVQQVMAREVRERIEVPEEELRQIYRDTRDEFRVPPALKLREIVVLADAVEDDRQRAEAARAVVREIESGGSFEEVAARTAAEGTTSEIIELGWVEEGDLDPSLEEAAWTLESGDLSDPIQGRGGHHILQVVERRDASVRSFEEVRDELAAREQERRFPVEYAEYLETLEERSYVELDLPPAAREFQGLGDGGEVSLPAEGASGA